MSRKGFSIWLAMLMLLASIVIIDIQMDIIPRAEAKTIYVDDDFGFEDATHKQTIQAAVDAAQPGDIVFVLNGTYHEDVYVDKTINLTGISRDNTTINCSTTGIRVENVDYVNVSGFTVENASSSGSGIAFIKSNNSLVYYCRVERNGCGITISNCNNTIVRDNIAKNTTNYDGIYISKSTNITINNNTCVNNSRGGIHVYDSSKDNIITNNTCNDNNYGIWVFLSDNNKIIKNQINGSEEYGIWVVNSNTNTIENASLSNNNNGIYVRALSEDVLIINCSITVSTIFDTGVDFDTQLTVINTTFNKSKAYFGDTISTITIKWYLHTNITNPLAQPIPNATVCIKDSQNSSPVQKYKTDPEGYVRWLVQTEYIEQDTDGDTIGEKTYYTPHTITAWNETLLGFAQVNMNESKEVNVVLDIPSYQIPLSAGWNLVSLPLVQADTDISTVLSSIAGSWEKVKWYNASDGQWHSTDGDLTELNHTMGFWIYMNTNDILTVTGEIPNKTYIPMYRGWNLVGNPSFCNHEIGDILASIADKYENIWTYYAEDLYDPWRHFHIDKPSKFNDLTYMTCTRGYWIYVNQDCIWEVSNF